MGSRYVIDYEADFTEKRSRLTTFFRVLLVLPHMLVLAVVGIAALFALIAGWVSVVVTGRMPAGIYAFLLGVVRLGTQVTAYLMLATDAFPPFGLDAQDHPVRVVGPAGPPAEQSRLKAFFRLLIAIPWFIVSQAYSYVAQLAAVCSWFFILVTGRQHPVLQKGITMGLAMQLRVSVFACLLTEDWPPFEPVLALEPRAEPPAITAA